MMMTENDELGRGAQMGRTVLPPWVQQELYRCRLAAYRNEIRCGPKPKLVNTDLEVSSQEGRPYGIPWELQGAVVDIWSLVFAFITDPKDIINMCDTSALFRDMLKRKYVQARFPEILDICSMRPHLGILLVKEEDRGPRLRTSLKNLFLTLRVVSKLTKKSAEDYVHAFENPEATRPHGIAVELLRAMCIVTNEHVDQLLRVVGRFGTVFPHRLVISDIDMVNPEREVEILLQRIGQSIHSIIYVASIYSPRASYNRILVWLRHTPNLRILKILTTIMIPLNRIGVAEDDRELEIPEFITLEKLEVYGDDVSFPEEIRVKILAANQTIRFVTQENRFNYSNHTAPVRVGTEVLEPLHLKQYMLMRSPPLSFYELEFVQWRLKKLSLVDRCPNPGDSDVVTSRLLFGFLNQFQNTLKELHVELKVKDTGGYLNLSHLTRFVWRVQRRLKSLDFMLPLGKLERFECYIGDQLNDLMYQAIHATSLPNPYTFTDEDVREKLEDNVVLQFYKGWRNKNFKDTNIKAFFPRLKSIVVHWSHDLQFETYPFGL